MQFMHKVFAGSAFVLALFLGCGLQQAGAEPDAILVIKPNPGFIISGGRVADVNSMGSLDKNVYDLGPGLNATVELKRPKDSPAHYNLSVLLAELVGTPACAGKEAQLLSCIQSGGGCEQLPSGCWARQFKVTNVGACNNAVAPVNRRIELALSCGGRDRCDCRIAVGTPAKSRANSVCPFTCQSYNPASGGCIGPETNRC